MKALDECFLMVVIVQNVFACLSKNYWQYRERVWKSNLSEYLLGRIRSRAHKFSLYGNSRSFSFRLPHGLPIYWFSSWKLHNFPFFQEVPLTYSTCSAMDVFFFAKCWNFLADFNSFLTKRDRSERVVDSIHQTTGN